MSGKSADAFDMEHYGESDTGICDECGAFTTLLSYLGGEWVCESCVRFG